MLEFGLSPATCSTIRRILADVPAVEKALNLDTLGHIAAQLDESPIPYQVDLSLFDHIDHSGLRDHIQRVGQVFYVQKPLAT